ncbi:hypothetical protein [Laspinema olomoucense]|nr:MULTISPECIES: hypothetical protein [unclassified Laspinema]
MDITLGHLVNEGMEVSETDYSRSHAANQSICERSVMAIRGTPG